MSQTYTAVMKQSGPWWIGWIEEVPGVNCQEPTREALLETLKVTLVAVHSCETSRMHHAAWARPSWSART